MSATSQHQPVDQEWKARLSRAAARRALAEADFYATVAEIGGAVPQTQMAGVLHTTQSAVSRWATRGRQLQLPAGQLGRTPYEIAQRYAAGELTREQMMTALIEWDYVPSALAPDNDWYGVPDDPPGSFELTTAKAYDDQLISAEDYDQILTGVSERAQANQHDTKH